MSIRQESRTQVAETTVQTAIAPAERLLPWGGPVRSPLCSQEMADAKKHVLPVLD